MSAEAIAIVREEILRLGTRWAHKNEIKTVLDELLARVSQRIEAELIEIPEDVYLRTQEDTLFHVPGCVRCENNADDRVLVIERGSPPGIEALCGECIEVMREDGIRIERPTSPSSPALEAPQDDIPF